MQSVSWADHAAYNILSKGAALFGVYLETMEFILERNVAVNPIQADGPIVGRSLYPAMKSSSNRSLMTRTIFLWVWPSIASVVRLRFESADGLNRCG